MSIIGDEAKEVLHGSAQKRAQKDIEDFIGKKVVNPYGTLGNRTLKGLSGFIEIYWCISPSQPLHDAYYSFYSRNKGVFSSTENLIKRTLESEKGVCEFN